MVYISNKNLLAAVKRLRNLAQVVSENREYFSDDFDYDVIETCKKVVELLNPTKQTDEPTNDR